MSVLVHNVQKIEPSVYRRVLSSIDPVRSFKRVYSAAGMQSMYWDESCIHWEQYHCSLFLNDVFFMVLHLASFASIAAHAIYR